MSARAVLSTITICALLCIAGIVVAMALMVARLPDTITATEVTAISITVDKINGAEYSINDGNTWQSSNIFEGLAPNTRYTITVRNSRAKEDVRLVEATTLKYRNTQVPGMYSADVLISADRITVNSRDNIECSTDNGKNWAYEIILSDLQPNTQHDITMRYAETPTTEAGEAVTYTYTTNKYARTISDTLEALDIASDSVTLTANPDYEYSINLVDWQSDNVISGLQPNTSYNAYARYRETNEYYASDTISVWFTTIKTTQSAPVITDEAVVTDNSITVQSIVGAEYSINNGATWQSSNIFEGLTGLTDYTVYVRYAETDTAYASASVSINITTLASAGLYNSSNVMTHSWTELVDSNYITVENNTIMSVTTNNIFTDAKLIIADGIVCIGSRAFSNCNISQVIMPDTITEIYESAFNNCKTLKKIKLSDNITVLSQSCFDQCESLEDVILPQNLITIKESAFQFCAKLKPLTFPDALERILGTAFYSTNTNLISKLPKSLIELGDWCFGNEGQINITTVDLPKLTTLGVGVFSKCANLTTVSVHTSAFKAYVFDGCTALRSVPRISSVGNYAFNGCESLTDITFWSSINTISSYAFCGVVGLTYLPDSIIRIEQYSLSGTGITEVVSRKITQLNNYAFANCKSLTSVDFSDSNISLIGDHVFAGCSKLTSIVLRGGYITPDIIEGCTALSYIKTMEDVTLNIVLNENNQAELFDGLQCKFICLGNLAIHITSYNGGEPDTNTAILQCSIDIYVANSDALRDAEIVSQIASKIHPLSEYSA